MAPPMVDPLSYPKPHHAAGRSLIIGRRALLFTNEDNPEQLRLHVRDIDLDHGTSTGLAVDENRDWPVWLFASDGDHVYTEDAVQTIHRRDAQTGADLTDLGQSY